MALADFEPWGIMCPLLVDKGGEKFGKTTMEQHAQKFYLSESKTSPFMLYQALLNVTDEMARHALYPLTHLTAYDVDRLLEEQVGEFYRRFPCNGCLDSS